MGLIVFLGDSITDADRKNSPNQLGYGYVNIFSQNLNCEKGNWHIINQGIDGQITQQVAQSLHSHCIALHPDYVSILVGINDIGLGPQGMGGKYSVMGVHIENTARHPSAIGVAVNVGCWSHRRGHIIFDKDLNYKITTHTGVTL